MHVKTFCLYFQTLFVECSCGIMLTAPSSLRLFKNVPHSWLRRKKAILVPHRQARENISNLNSSHRALSHLCVVLMFLAIQFHIFATFCHATNNFHSSINCHKKVLAYVVHEKWMLCLEKQQQKMRIKHVLKERNCK